MDTLGGLKTVGGDGSCDPWELFFLWGGGLIDNQVSGDAIPCKNGQRYQLYENSGQVRPGSSSQKWRAE